jgi:hypothetical protein
MFVAAAARARHVCEPLAALIEGGSADRADLRLSAVEALALVDQALDGLPAAGGGGVEGGVVRRGAGVSASTHAAVAAVAAEREQLARQLVRAPGGAELFRGRGQGCRCGCWCMPLASARPYPRSPLCPYSLCKACGEVGV